MKTLSVSFGARQPLTPIAHQVRDELTRRVRGVLVEMSGCTCPRCVDAKVDDLLVGHGLVMAAFGAVVAAGGEGDATFDATFAGVRELMKDVPHRILERSKTPTCLK